MSMGSDQAWDVCFAVTADRVNGLIEQALQSGKLALPVIAWKSDDGASLDAVMRSFQFPVRGTANGTVVPVLITLKSGRYSSFLGDEVLDDFGFYCTMDFRRIDQPGLMIFAIAPSSDFQIDPVNQASVSEDGVAGVTAALAVALPTVLASFKPVLATFDGQSAGLQALPWLAPKASGHAYIGVTDAPAGAIDDDVGLTDPSAGSRFQSAGFAFLAMVDPFVAGNAPPVDTPDRDLLPNGCEASFSVSQATFTRHILFPAAIQAFFGRSRALDHAEIEKIGRERLLLAEQDTVIKSRAGSAPIELKTVDVDLSALYSVFAGAILMPVTIPAAFLTLLATLSVELIEHGRPNLFVPMKVSIESVDFKQADGKVKFHAEIRATLDIGSLNLAVIRMTMNSDLELKFENGTTSFKSSNASHTTPVVTAPDWLRQSHQAVEVILSVVGEILVVVTEGEAAVAIAIAAAAATVALNQMPKVIEAGLSHGAGISVPADFSAFVANAVAPMTFLDGHKFVAEAATLNRKLVFGGRLVAPPPPPPVSPVIRRSGAHWAIE